MDAEGRPAPRAGDASPILRIEGLTKRYGDFTAVDGLDLEARAGEIVAILGPNGAGKTTTIRMVMGILRPDRGRASVEGRDCFGERAEVKRAIGYLPDEPIFYDYLRGSETIRFAAAMHGLDSRDADRRAAPLVERLELADALEEFAMNYSRGMKKKLALVVALLHEPRLLILDEPTNGLDPLATRTLHEVMRELSGAGVAVLFSTHLLDQAEKVAGRVAILRSGRRAAFGPLEELREGLAPGGSLEDVFFQVTGPGGDASPQPPPPESEPGERG